ncbi:MAG: Hsp20 family protein [Rhodobacteraceae bacterium]|nr:Hsp20 family protein [Paracoccaceae bacterium]
MAKSNFSGHPSLLGFDRIDRLLERTEKTASDGYPPYNIEQTSQNSIRISIAVAGFGEDDISVEIEDQQLTLSGKQPPSDRKRVFLHRGIAARQFQRSFILADGMEVRQAVLANGLLHVDLERLPAERRVMQVKITRG